MQVCLSCSLELALGHLGSQSVPFLLRALFVGAAEPPPSHLGSQMVNLGFLDSLGHPVLPGTILGHSGLSGATLGHSGIARTILGHSELPGATSGHSGFSGASLGDGELPGAMLGHSGLPRASLAGTHLGLLGFPVTSLGFLELCL